MSTIHGWFQVEQFAGGIIQIGEPGHYENVKSWLVEGKTHVALIDTGMGVSGRYQLVESLTDRQPLVLISHGHFDHIGSAHFYPRILVHELESDKLRAGYPNQRYRPWFAREYMREIPLPEGFDPLTAEIPPVEPSGYLNDGDLVDLGGIQLEALHTPGHTPGSMAFFDRSNGALFPSDAIGHCSLLVHREECDPVGYRDTLQRLATLADSTDQVFVPHEKSPLGPQDLVDIHDAYEEVWAGTKPVSRKRPDADIYEFPEFSFWLPPDWNSER